MQIRCVAHAVIRRRDEDAGERSEQAVRREVLEELGVELSRIDRLRVLENIFDFDGRRNHQICFAFDCTIADWSFCSRALPSPRCRRAVRGLRLGREGLVPDGLVELIQPSPYQSS
jgi:8-oxo-dGTP pyrophosphatase MutT (NUDIX family)